MVSLTVLLAWMTLGLFIALALSRPGEPRLAWAPMAILLGPLWLAVVVERRQQPIVGSNRR